MIKSYSPLSHQHSTIQIPILKKNLQENVQQNENTFPLVGEASNLSILNLFACLPATIHSSLTWITPITCNISSSCRLLNSFATSGSNRLDAPKLTFPTMNECPLKRDHFNSKFHLPNHQFSGDILIFKGVAFAKKNVLF